LGQIPYSKTQKEEGLYNLLLIYNTSELKLSQDMQINYSLFFVLQNKQQQQHVLIERASLFN